MSIIENIIYNSAMKNIVKKIKYFLLAQKEKNLQKKLKRTTKSSFTNKTSKRILGEAADVTFNTETLKKIEEVKTNVSSIVKKTNCNPDELLRYIETTKTPVYRINRADKLLRFLQEEEGLICEQKGIRALYLSIITGRMPRLQTPPMFVLRHGEIEKYYFLHHFYRWYSLKSDLPGFEYEVQQKFKKLFLDDSEDTITKLSMEDIISIKEAITRDNEASDFVLNYTKEIDGSKNVIDKIKNEGSANI